MEKRLQLKISEDSDEIMIIYPNGKCEWAGFLKAICIAVSWMACNRTKVKVIE